MAAEAHSPFKKRYPTDDISAYHCYRCLCGGRGGVNGDGLKEEEEREAVGNHGSMALHMKSLVC